jgi:hypothetical protein
VVAALLCAGVGNSAFRTLVVLAALVWAMRGACLGVVLISCFSLRVAESSTGLRDLGLAVSLFNLTCVLFLISLEMLVHVSRS